MILGLFIIAILLLFIIAERTWIIWTVRQYLEKQDQKQESLQESTKETWR